MLIGIVGKSGSGKSTIAKELKELIRDSIIIDIDKIGHQVEEKQEVIEELVEAFGEVVLKQGKIDRKVLGNIVFTSKTAMEKLTEITWKHMEREIDRILREHPKELVILDWLLLPKTKYFKACDLRILVTAPYEVRKERAMARDGISEEAFQKRDQNSIFLDPNDFDQVIENGEKAKTKEKVKTIYDKSIISG